MMDFVYDPTIATMITEWVAYITPVPEAQDLIRQHADTAPNPTTQKTLHALADSPLVFLPPGEQSSLHTDRELKDDNELDGWDELVGRFMVA